MENLDRLSNITLNISHAFSNETGTNLSTEINTSVTIQNEFGNKIVSDSLKSDIEFAIYVIFMPLFCSCGIVGNALALDVFVDMARRSKHAVYIYMFTLVTVDSLFMFVFIVRSIHHVIGAFDAEQGSNIEVYTAVLGIYLDLLFRAMNSVTLILMCLERLVAIRSPYLVKETILAKYPMQILVVVFSVLVIALLPLPICLEVRRIVGPNGNIVNEVVSRENMDDFFFSFIVMETIICEFLPYVILLCLNIGIFLQYRRVLRKRKQVTSKVNKNGNFEMQLRLMASVTVILFMYTVLTLPQMSIQTLSVVDDRFSFEGSESNLFWAVSDISNALIVVNCSIDFIIYILMSSAYRTRFKEKFCCRCTTEGEEAEIAAEQQTGQTVSTIIGK